MLRGPLGKEKYKAKFSGHDTFPFRQSWLSKIVQYLEDGNIQKIREFEKNKLHTMAELGIGLNMVKAIRHWCVQTKVTNKDFKITDFGKLIFSNKGALDPFLEKSETLWLLHWMLASDENLTTWFYVFNYHQSIMINREQLLHDLLSVGRLSKWKGISPNTIKRDVDVFLRTYTVGLNKKGEITEDSLECPLAELGLINTTYSKNEFEIQRGAKPTLSYKIFEFALNDYWSKQKSAIITFEKLLYDFGSPGRVFQLDEKALDFYLESLEETNHGIFQFNKGAGGLRQITKTKNSSSTQLLKNCYKKVA